MTGVVGEKASQFGKTCFSKEVSTQNNVGVEFFSYMIDTYLSPLTESLPTQVEPLELLLETLCRGETPFELVPSLAINSSGLRPPVASVSSANTKEKIEKCINYFCN